MSLKINSFDDLKGSTLDLIDEGVIVCDKDGKVQWCNQAAKEFLKISQDSLISKEAFEKCRFLHFDGTTEISKKEIPLFQALAGKKIADVEMMITSPGKETHYVVAKAEPLLTTDGQRYGAAMFLNSINELKHLKEKLIESVSKMKALEFSLRERTRLTALRAEISSAFNTGNDLTFVLQTCAEALVKHLAAAFARIWLLDDAGEVLELKASAGLYTHLNGAHGRVRVGDFKIGRIAKNRAPHISNSVISDPEVSNPEWAKLEGMRAFAGYPLLLEDRLLGVMAFFSRDEISEEVLDELAPIADGISQWTKRKKSEQELFKQQEWFSVTLRAIGDAVMATNTEGHITFINPIAEALCGWKLSEARGQPLQAVFNITHEHPGKSVDNPVEKVLKEKRIVALDSHTVLISRTGERIPIEDSAAPIFDAEQNMIGVVLVFRDVTESRKVQYQLQNQSQELEQLVGQRTMKLQKALGEMEAFSYTVSHDLRSPLRSIQGLSTILISKYSNEVPSEVVDYLSRISRAAERLDKLTQDLLTYGSIVGKEVALEPINLNQLVKDIVEQYPSLHLSKAKINIIGILNTVLGNASFITQIISNLLTNAVKYVEPGKIPEIRIWNELKDKKVRLWIEDNGIGIRSEDQKKIFNMFERGDNIPSYEGTGMGLAIAKKAAEQMRAELGVESELNKGSKFWIDFTKF